MKNKEYPNIELINEAERVASEIIANKRSNHHRDKFFPMMIDGLNLKYGVEIGTDKGEFAHHLLERSKLTNLCCIDPWIDDFGSDHKPGYYDKIGDNRYNAAFEKLKKFIEVSRCQPIRGFSANASQGWQEESVDFIYIDGDHSLEGVYTDLYSWIGKVRIGGIVSGHDYKDGPKSGMQDYFGEQLPYRVKTVVDNFCQQYGYKLHTVGGRVLSFWFVRTH